MMTMMKQPFVLLYSILYLLPFLYADLVTTPPCVELNSLNGIVIGFENYNNSQLGDWLGLYPSHLVDSTTTTKTEGTVVVPGIPQLKPFNWVWSCGSRTTCLDSSKTDVGPVLIAHPQLTPGQWVAVLARWTSTPPYPVIHYSAPFRVVETDCTISTQIAVETTPPPTTAFLFPTTQPTSDHPTRLPTRPPTLFPTASPSTPMPTTAPLLEATKSQFAFNEELVISFDMGASAKANDWIGIYDESFALEPGERAGSALLWVWNCGNTDATPDCEGIVSSGTVTIGGNSNHDWETNWPLVPGRYKAVLFHDCDNCNSWEVARVSSEVLEVTIPTQLSDESLTLVRRELETLIDDEGIALAAKFLRLGFHDCAGGCDGCVDLREIKNRGLEIPILALKPLAQKYNNLLSRADLWAMATLVGADVQQPRSTNRRDFSFDSWGRQNCEDIYQECFNENDEPVECREDRGPAHFIPGINIQTDDLFQFFADEFDFNTREAVAIMGAHTVGELARDNSGVDGENGWVVGQRRLDNEYYVELVGGTSVDSPLSELINDAPTWVRRIQDNDDLRDFDDTAIWIGRRSVGEIIMLNADIGLVRHLVEGDNMDDNTGEVSCAFIERFGTTCPHFATGLREAARYRFDNDAWLTDFDATLRKMVRNGYDATNNECTTTDVCRLQWNRS